MGAGRQFDPEEIRRKFSALDPKRSVAARVREIAKAVGCAKPTVVRAVKRGDQRKAGASTTTGPSHDRTRLPVALSPRHPAVLEGHTAFPSMVRDVGGEALLKSAENSAKIGRVVMKGVWKGFPIFTLTLEERASCPKTCALWGGCYGNNTPFARRFRHGPDLERRLALEVAALELKHPRGFVVRLHNLGDFYSWTYVDVWRELLDRHPALHVFGYTAHVDPETDIIARSLIYMSRTRWRRFAMRFSNGWAKVATTVTVEHEAGAPADAILCPAQMEKTESCATCALCWSTRRRIAFLRH